jgi:protein-S-isoprenylcysteine O-methyltransferase Ste14
MSNAPVLALHLLTFGVIGLLPRVFFRRDGRLGARWWLTALPFFACPVLLLAAFVLDVDPLVSGAWRAWLAVVSVPLSVAAVALVFLTVGTHRAPLALWHQDNDAPAYLVTDGPYRRIRHPFYASFLLAFAAAVAYFPHWGTLLALIYAVVALNLTAAREERRLAASRFGEEYRRYLARTGRFLPRPR